MRELPPRLADPGLAPLWARCWRAMARAGPEQWPSVTITVPIGDGQERRAVGGLRGRPVRPGTASVGIVLGELDTVLRRAGDGWDLRAVVETVAGPLPDRAGDAQERARAVESAVRRAETAGVDEPWFRAWLGELATDGTLSRLYRRGELDLLGVAVTVLRELPGTGGSLPLPVLASRVTHDTKALRSGTLATLSLRAIAARLGEPRPTTAAARRALWESAGVVPDDLASQVLVLNLPVRGGVVGGWLEGAAAAGLPFRVTLHQLTIGPPTHVVPTPVFVCENPAVLRSAAERFGPGAGAMVCTEGRPSVAAVRLCALLAAGGCESRYHGDFDWPGLRIAAGLLEGVAGVEPWRFGAADYRAAVAADSPGRRLTGPAAPSPWDPELARAMAEVGEVVYEEDVIETLLADLGPRT